MISLKRIGKTLLILTGLFAVLIVGLFVFGRSRLNAAPEIATKPITVSTDSDSIERGRYLASVSACSGCHGGNLSGKVFTDEAPIGYVPAPNLTSGAGGIGSDYADADWERAIRHGVTADGRTMVIMPSDHYASYSDDDVANLIAFLKSLPPVDNDLGDRKLQFGGNIIFGVMAYSSWSVSTIDHAAVGSHTPQPQPSAEYGAYLKDIASCASCHAENMAGNYGQLDTPQGPNLTILQNNWTLEEFKTTLRSGSTPDGRQLIVEMPWPQYSAMSDGDIEALWEYLNSLKALPNNS